MNYLLHQGALIDVVGRGLAKVKPMVPRVLERHPRLEFKRRIVETLTRETARHPHGRLAMVNRAGFLEGVTNLLAESGLNSGALELELTERVLMRD